LLRYTWAEWGCNKKLQNDLYFLPNIIKVIKSEEDEVGKKRCTEKTTSKHRHKLENNIKMNCKEMKW
jgi:hypothetical protein